MNIAFEANRLRDRIAQAGLPDGCVIQRNETERRVIPISRGHHVRGRHPIRSNHPAVPFESALECSFLSAIAPLPCLLRVVSQPVTVFYSDHGRNRHYTPDFLLELSQVPDSLARLGFGIRTMVEVKPLELAQKFESDLVTRLRVLRCATFSSVSLVTKADVLSITKGGCHGR
jgi:hypothetical protein